MQGICERAIKRADQSGIKVWPLSSQYGALKSRKELTVECCSVAEAHKTIIIND